MEKLQASRFARCTRSLKGHWIEIMGHVEDFYGRMGRQISTFVERSRLWVRILRRYPLHLIRYNGDFQCALNMI